MILIKSLNFFVSLWHTNMCEGPERGKMAYFVYFATRKTIYVSMGLGILSKTRE